jgi:hypothetical protein
MPQVDIGGIATHYRDVPIEAQTEDATNARVLEFLKKFGG